MTSIKSNIADSALDIYALSLVHQKEHEQLMLLNDYFDEYQRTMAEVIEETMYLSHETDNFENIIAAGFYTTEDILDNPKVLERLFILPDVVSYDDPQYGVGTAMLIGDGLSLLTKDTLYKHLFDAESFGDSIDYEIMQLKRKSEFHTSYDCDKHSVLWDLPLLYITQLASRYRPLSWSDYNCQALGVMIMLSWMTTWKYLKGHFPIGQDWLFLSDIVLSDNGRYRSLIDLVYYRIQFVQESQLHMYYSSTFVWDIVEYDIYLSRIEAGKLISYLHSAADTDNDDRPSSLYLIAHRLHSGLKFHAL